MLKLLVVCGALLTSSLALAEDVQLSTYSTDFPLHGENENRASNVRLATQRINAIEVWPGDTFSYNEVVGERSQKNGFKLAHVILKKRLEDDWGGGACQVASTLHAAVMVAGVEITESHPHSLASSYMQPGMDSTVSWPRLDFKFRNNTQRVIRIVATTEEVTVAEKKRVYTKGRLTVQLISDRPSGRMVDIKFKVLKTQKRPTWTIKSATVKRGSVVHQAGSNGYEIDRTYRVWDAATGEVLVDQKRRFKFAPLARIVLIPKEG